MHYTGTIWRPPYEAGSLLLEATAGCTHHKCKFCTLYEELPFRFRLSPLEDIESDLLEAQLCSKDPIAMLSARLQGFTSPANIRRVFLTGANPFVLRYERLMKISDLIRQYLPTVESIGCFARVTDMELKSDEELHCLRLAGYDGLTIGIETGDDDALRFMNKGYQATDIVKQCTRLDEAGIRYAFFYLTGISGRGKGARGAMLTAEVCNQLHPWLVGPNMLTVYPDSALYQEIQAGNWQEESEIEKYREMHVLVEHLDIPTEFAAMGASNAITLHGTLPKDKGALLATLDKIIETVPEAELQSYRQNLPHL